MPIGKAEKCLAGCQVTKHKVNKSSLLCSTNPLGALDHQKIGWHACIRALCLGNGIMGACFQAPHAAPGQRPMETFYISQSLILCLFICTKLPAENSLDFVCIGLLINTLSFHLDRDRWKHYPGWGLMGCLEPLTISHKVNLMSNNNNRVSAAKNE